jgi:hypothetical protein
MTADTPHTPGIQAPALPAPPRPDNNVPVHLERLAETARDYARGAKAAATQRRLRRRLAPLLRLVPPQGA